MRIRFALATGALSVAMSLLLAPRTAAAQGSEATGLGVGVQAMLVSDLEVETVPGTFVSFPTIAGPSVVYQTPKFHIDGILAYGDVEDFTTLAIGGRFYYELHSTQASDLSIGGGLGLINISVGDESDTSFQLEAGGKIRAFLAPSVAINAALGLGYITNDDFDYVIFGGQLIGSVGLTYFFF